MEGSTAEEVVRRYAEAVVRGDLGALDALRHREWTCDWPQSRERVGSSAAWRAIYEHYPGGSPSTEVVRLIGPEDRWLVTPSNTVVRVAGCGEFWWSEWTVTYPDGRDYLAVALLALRDGLVHREVTYWSEPFEAPPWRSQWVERTA